jgi:hypothetical protein
MILLTQATNVPTLTFPKWCANRRQDRLKLPSGQAFFSLRGACGRANARSWAIRPVNPQHIGPAAVTELELSAVPALRELWCCKNKLTELDIRSCLDLTHVRVDPWAVVHKRPDQTVEHPKEV